MRGFCRLLTSELCLVLLAWEALKNQHRLFHTEYSLVSALSKDADIPIPTGGVLNHTEADNQCVPYPISKDHPPSLGVHYREPPPANHSSLAQDFGSPHSPPRPDVSPVKAHPGPHRNSGGKNSSPFYNSQLTLNFPPPYRHTDFSPSYLFVSSQYESEDFSLTAL